MMKVLIAEDDFASRKFLLRFLQQYGECDVTVDGQEAIEAFEMAMEDEEPYDLICLDIMMPGVDGYEALKAIRKMEEERDVPESDRVKIIMTTALNDGRNVTQAFSLGCVAYTGKPSDKEKFLNELEKLGLVKEGAALR